LPPQEFADGSFAIMGRMKRDMRPLLHDTLIFAKARKPVALSQLACGRTANVHQTSPQ
jgi:hypothetical protein